MVIKDDKRILDRLEDVLCKDLRVLDLQHQSFLFGDIEECHDHTINLVRDRPIGFYAHEIVNISLGSDLDLLRDQITEDFQRDLRNVSFHQVRRDMPDRSSDICGYEVDYVRGRAGEAFQMEVAVEEYRWDA